VRRRPSCAVKEATNCDTGPRGDDADRKDAHLASGCGDDWGSACARAGGEENHVRVGKAVANFLQRLLGRRLADLRPRAGAETLGQLRAHLDNSLGARGAERLRVSISDDEVVWLSRAYRCVKLETSPS
jgi:hypothetical protein